MITLARQLWKWTARLATALVQDCWNGGSIQLTVNHYLLFEKENKKVFKLVQFLLFRYEDVITVRIRLGMKTKAQSFLLKLKIL